MATREVRLQLLLVVWAFHGYLKYCREQKPALCIWRWPYFTFLWAMQVFRLVLPWTELQPCSCSIPVVAEVAQKLLYSLVSKTSGLISWVTLSNCLCRATVKCKIYSSLSPSDGCLMSQLTAGYHPCSFSTPWANLLVAALLSLWISCLNF